MLIELGDARRDLADAVGLGHGTVVVASETLLTLTQLFAEVRAEHPGMRVRLLQSNADEMAQQLRARDIDVCFASQPLAGPALSAIELSREDVLLAVPNTHFLAGRGHVGIGELLDEPFVTSGPGHWSRVLLDKLFAEAGTRPTIICEGDEAAALEMIGAGNGIGLVPATAHRAADDLPVAFVRLDSPQCFRALTTVWRPDASLSVAARRFRDLAVEHFLPAATA